MTDDKKRTRNYMVTCAVTGEQISRRKSIEMPDLGGRVKKSLQIKCHMCAQEVPLVTTILTSIGRVCARHEGVLEQATTLDLITTKEEEGSLD